MGITPAQFQAATDALVALSEGVKQMHVATPAGERRYGAPIGTPLPLPKEPELRIAYHDSDVFTGDNPWVEATAVLTGGTDYRGEPNMTPVAGKRITKTELPDVMYHITTNADAVAQSGVLRMQDAGDNAGLGGGHKNTVSLTTDRDVALRLRDDMKLFARLKQLDSTDAIDSAVVAYGERCGMDGYSMERGFLYNCRVERARVAEGKSTIGGYIDYVTTQFFSQRSHEGKGRNPVIFGGYWKDDSPWWQINPDNIGVIRVRKADIPDEVLITDFDRGRSHGLEEVRVHGDIPLGVNQVSGIRIRRAEKALAGLQELLETKDVVRHIRTRAGEIRYGGRIGDVITRDMVAGATTPIPQDELAAGTRVTFSMYGQQGRRTYTGEVVERDGNIGHAYRIRYNQDGYSHVLTVARGDLTVNAPSPRLRRRVTPASTSTPAPSAPGRTPIIFDGYTGVEVSRVTNGVSNVYRDGRSIGTVDNYGDGDYWVTFPHRGGTLIEGGKRAAILELLKNDDRIATQRQARLDRPQRQESVIPDREIIPAFPGVTLGPKRRSGGWGMEARPVFLNGENIGRLEQSWRRSRQVFAYLPRGSRAIAQSSNRLDALQALLKSHAERNGAVVPDRVRQTSRGQNRVAIPSMPGVEITPSADTNTPTGVFIDGVRVGSIHYNGRTSHYTFGTSRLPSQSFPGGRLSRDAALKALVDEALSSPAAQQEAAEGRREVAAGLARQRARAARIQRRAAEERRAALAAASRRRRPARRGSTYGGGAVRRVRPAGPAWLEYPGTEVLFSVPDPLPEYTTPEPTRVARPDGVDFLGEKDGAWYYTKDSSVFTIRKVNGYYVGSRTDRVFYDKERRNVVGRMANEHPLASAKEIGPFMRGFYDNMDRPWQYGESPRASFNRGFGDMTAPMWLKDIVADVKAGKRKPTKVKAVSDDDSYTSLDSPALDPEYAVLAVSAFEVEGNGFTSVVDFSESTFYGEGMHVEGEVFYDGKKVGTFGMDVELEKKNIYAASMDVESSHQSQGFAMVFAMQSQSTVADQGITTVTVSANCDVGGYAWARRGFAFQNKEDSLEAKHFFREIAAANPGDRINGGRQYEEATGYDFIASERLIAAAKAMLARYNGPRNNWPESWEIASFGEDMPETHWTKKPRRGTVDVPMWPGKGAMLGTSWSGVRPVFIADEFKAMGDDWMVRVRAMLPYAESVYVPDDYLNWNLRSDYHLMSADVLLGPAGMESKSVPLNANDVATTLASLQGVMEKE